MRRVAILGGTKGMGRALARLCAARGDRVCLLGRDQEELGKSVADLTARGAGAAGSVPCDLEDASTFDAALDTAVSQLGGLDLVIVTAAAFATQAQLEADRARLQRLLTMNFTNTILFCEAARARLMAGPLRGSRPTDVVGLMAGPLHGSRPTDVVGLMAGPLRGSRPTDAVGLMAGPLHGSRPTDVVGQDPRSGPGHPTLCVFSSVAGERGRKPVILYGATKAGLSQYLEGLDHKYHSQGLRVVCVKPGFVKTSMTEGLPTPPFAGEPDAVAATVMKAIDRGTPVVYAPPIWALIMMVIRWLPRAVMRKIEF